MSAGIVLWWTFFCCRDKIKMSFIIVFTARLAVLVLLHAAGAGQASPAVLVTRPVPRHVEWLPNDNQTVYLLQEGEKRSLELNTSMVSQRTVYITVSPCVKDSHWALYQGLAGTGHLTLLREYTGQDTSVISIIVSEYTRYVLQLSSAGGGGVVVSVRGEETRPVRMRLRFRSRRRLSANWETSPIDPQETAYCVVASRRKNYTSLCAAQYDSKVNRLDKPQDSSQQTNLLDNNNRYSLTSDTVEKSYTIDSGLLNKLNRNSMFSDEVDNKIEADIYNIYGGTRSVYRRKKFGRSTKATDVDPVVACVGERTHHFIENLDPSLTYFVSVFAVGKDRQAGTLLAADSVKPKTSTAKRLRENVPARADVRGKTVYYFKATVGTNGGVWITVTTCGGGVDVEVLVRGKRIYFAKNIEPHLKFFVPVVISSSSIQETSDEGSVQYDSSSEETKIRYVIKIMSQAGSESVGVELTASTSRWGLNVPELMEDGATVRELRPRRSCRSIDVAFLPAVHNSTDVIRYCITARDSIASESFTCATLKKTAKTQCVDHMQRPPARVIIQKVNGLRPGRKYAIQITAANKGSFVPYKVLYADTNASCKEE